MNRRCVFTSRTAAVVVAAVCAAGCGSDGWSIVRADAVVRRAVGDTAGASRAAERLLNIADSDPTVSPTRVLESLELLTPIYREQQAYGKEEISRHREVRLWQQLNAPSAAADTSTAAEADQDIEDVKNHYASTGLLNPTSLTLLGNMADQYFVSGRYRRAEALMLKVLDLRMQVAGPPDAVAAVQYRLGESYLFLGKPADAEPRLREALRLRRTIYGNGHFLLVSPLISLSDALAATGRADAGVDPLREALTIVQAQFGDVHPVTAEYMDRLAALLHASGHSDEAAAMKARAAESRRRF